MKRKKGLLAGIVLAVGILGGTGMVYYQITQYDYIGEYNEFGLARVEKDGRYGYINEEKEEIIPVTFDNVDSFISAGLVVVSGGGKEGCYDEEGNIVYPVEYSDVSFQEIKNSNLIIISL